MFSRDWQRFYVFPRLAAVPCFPALGSGSMFSRAWQRFHVFPRLAAVPCFPALDTRAWRRFHVYPHLLPVAFFPELWQQLNVFLQVMVDSSCNLPLFLSLRCGKFGFMVFTTTEKILWRGKEEYCKNNWSVHCSEKEERWKQWPATPWNLFYASVRPKNHTRQNKTSKGV